VCKFTYRYQQSSDHTRSAEVDAVVGLPTMDFDLKHPDLATPFDLAQGLACLLVSYVGQE
jgi:hypothetical protein